MSDNERRMIPRAIDITREINYKELPYIIRELQHLMEKYGPKSYITVEDECYYESTTVKVYLNYETPQTDEELESMRSVERQRELDERADYERLKAKFEVKE